LTIQIGGGDLDGDMYWVSAYPEFVKYIKPEPPADYPAPIIESIQPGVDIAEKVPYKIDLCIVS
jgi:hypothetical protein